MATLTRKSSGYHAFIHPQPRIMASLQPVISTQGRLSLTTDLWSFGEINTEKCADRLLPLTRGRLGGGRFSLLTPAFDVQEIMLTLA